MIKTFLSQPLQRPNWINSSTAAFYSSIHDSQSGKNLLSLLPMTANFSETECNDDGLHRSGPRINHPPDVLLSSSDTSSNIQFQSRFINLPSICPGPTPLHSKDATPCQIREVTNEKHKNPRKMIESKMAISPMLNAHSIVRKIQSLRLLEPSFNSDFLLITETWFSDCTVDDAVAIPG